MSLSGSLAEARDLYNLLAEIETKIQDVNASLGSRDATHARRQAEELHLSLWELYLIARRVKSLMSSIGFGEDVQAWVSLIFRIIYLLQVLNLTIAAIEAATGPIGWVMAGTRMLSGAVALNELREFAENYRRW